MLQDHCELRLPHQIAGTWLLDECTWTSHGFPLKHSSSSVVTAHHVPLWQNIAWCASSRQFLDFAEGRQHQDCKAGNH
ncbi:hypothetical protein MRX96_044931 [Rhipicephalus microplus]